VRVSVSLKKIPARFCPTAAKKSYNWGGFFPGVGGSDLLPVQRMILISDIRPNRRYRWLWAATVCKLFQGPGRVDTVLVLPATDKCFVVIVFKLAGVGREAYRPTSTSTTWRTVLLAGVAIALRSFLANIDRWNVMSSSLYIACPVSTHPGRMSGWADEQQVSVFVRCLTDERRSCPFANDSAVNTKLEIKHDKLPERAEFNS